MEAENPQNSQKLLDYTYASGVFSNYISGLGTAQVNQDRNRDVRRNIVNVDAMRSQGALQPGHTYVGVKLVESNISNALPPLLQYLKNSPRMATFSPGTNAYLDAEFTRVMQYPGWEVPYIKLLDSAEQNGMGYAIVRYDESRVGNVDIEFVEYARVAYDRSLTSLQDSPAVLIKHKITAVSFYEWDAYERFDQGPAYEYIKKMLAAQTQTASASGEGVNIYEAFMKLDGTVYRSWYVPTTADWLKAPEPFNNGVKMPVPIVDAPTAENPMLNAEPRIEWQPDMRVDYPIVAKYYTITSNDRHDYIEGRAFADEHKQEAASSLMSALVNGSLQASKTMWSPDGQNLDGGLPAQLTMEIKENAVWKTPMKAFQALWPDPSIIKTVESIIQQNATENNQVAWAVNNRKDTRKTAAEIKAAEGMQQQISGSDALVFSIFLRELFTQCWAIVQSSALQGRIKFMPDMPVEERDAALRMTYEIKPAGDVDFIEKQQRLQAISEDLAMFQGTPLGAEMQKEYIRLRYPEKFTAWSALLAQQDQAKQLVQALGGALQEAVTDPATGQLLPQFQPEAQNLEQLQANVQQFLQPAAANAGSVAPVA